MAKLAAAVLDVPVLAEICRAKQMTVTVSGRSVTLVNHNRLLSMYTDAIGLKTGFTKKAGRCLVSAAQRDGVTLIAVTLDDPDDWDDHMALYDYGFSVTRSVTLPRVSSRCVAVAGGTADGVNVRGEGQPIVTLSDGEADRVTCRVELPPFVWAPVQTGKPIGMAYYELDGMVIYQTPLIATQTIAAKEPLGFLKNWMRQVQRLLTAI